jgi:hypothetical protein
MDADIDCVADGDALRDEETVAVSDCDTVVVPLSVTVRVADTVRPLREGETDDEADEDVVVDTLVDTDSD